MKRLLTSIPIRRHTRCLATEATSTSGVAPSLRPDLDFDFLLEKANSEKIRQNIRERKGVGDIDALHEKWATIQKMINGQEKPEEMTEEKYEQLWNELYEEALNIPNMSKGDVPRGGPDRAKIIAEWGEKKETKCPIAEKLVQSWRLLLHPTEASGERSYVLMGGLESLEKALLDYAYRRCVVLGFKPVTVPDIVAGDVTAACGVSQRTQQEIQYSLTDDHSAKLSGTAEMGIAAFMRGRTFKQEQLPVRVVALSRCFRPEISKAASEAKLYRVHEFTKVEMFSICAPEQSEEELKFLADIQKGTFESLGLHCRQLLMPSEELGSSAAKKIDIEAWMPGRQLFGEVSSASNCTDFQSRRLGIKYKTSEGETRHVHTCNGTALASTRSMIAVLETFQNEKKKLDELPDVLKNNLRPERSAPLRFQSAKSLV